MSLLSTGRRNLSTYFFFKELAKVAPMVAFMVKTVCGHFVRGAFSDLTNNSVVCRAAPAKPVGGSANN